MAKRKNNAHTRNIIFEMIFHATNLLGRIYSVVCIVYKHFMGAKCASKKKPQHATLTFNGINMYLFIYLYVCVMRGESVVEGMKKKLNIAT